VVRSDDLKESRGGRLRSSKRKVRKGVLSKTTQKKKVDSVKEGLLRSRRQKARSEGTLDLKKKSLWGGGDGGATKGPPGGGRITSAEKCVIYIRE